MSQNIPVRFVRADGETIQLPVTTVTLDVDRNFNATPLIFMGSDRMATDFNLSRAVILLEGVFTDDDLMSIGSATSSRAVIDFSINEVVKYGGAVVKQYGNINFDNEDLIDDGFSEIALDDIASLQTLIKLKNTAGVEFDLYASKSNLSHAEDGGTSRYHFSIATTNGVQTTNTLVGGTGYSIANDVATSSTGPGVNCKVNITAVNSGAITEFNIAHPGSGHVVGDVLTISAGGNNATFTVASVGTALTAEQMATNFTKLINDSGLSNPITGLSATLTTSPNTAKANSAVTITQTVAGKNGNSGTPKFNDFVWDANLQVTPRFTTFKGGSDQGGIFSGMSAGDKVMSLYGTLNNSKNNKGLQKKDKFGDYIIGIQIPFNSSINATGSNKYEPVNFFMPTGRFETLDSKSVEDAVSASTKPDEPDSNNDRSFIKGGVTKATFVQVGGEPVYSFNIQFIPASYII
jgi:hypothetical protein